MLSPNLTDAAMLVSLWLDLARADMRLRLHRGANRKLLFHAGREPGCVAKSGSRIDAAIGRLARLMTAAARLHGPFNFSCLRQALVLQARLRRLGVEARLSYGVKKQGSRIVAHAWLDIGGRTINGLPEIVPLQRPARDSARCIQASAAADSQRRCDGGARA